MTASCLSTPLAAAARPMPERRCRDLAGISRGLSWPLAVALLLLGAALLAPEQPAAQADICQRHYGIAACRVW